MIVVEGKEGKFPEVLKIMNDFIYRYKLEKGELPKIAVIDTFGADGWYGVDQYNCNSNTELINAIKNKDNYIKNTLEDYPMTILYINGTKNEIMLIRDLLKDLSDKIIITLQNNDLKELKVYDI